MSNLPKDHPSVPDSLQLILMFFVVMMHYEKIQVAKKDELSTLSRLFGCSARFENDTFTSAQYT